MHSHFRSSSYICIKDGQTLTHFFADGVKDLVLVDVGGVLVVLAVGKLPAVVRAQQERVHCVPHHIVQPVVLGEGRMAAVVTHHKDGREECPLQQPVRWQQHKQQPRGEQPRGPDPLRHQESHHYLDAVSEHVVHGGGDFGVKDVLGQGALDVDDGRKVPGYGQFVQEGFGFGAVEVGGRLKWGAVT